MFLNNSETGDFFSIKILENSESSGLDIWKISADVILEEQNLIFENYNLSGKPALRTLDGLNVFTVTNDYAYFIKYNLGQSGIINFHSTFEMMLNSFILVENNE